jgi:hypothetical protein
MTRSQDAGAARYQEYMAAASTTVQPSTMQGFVLQGKEKPNGSTTQANTRSTKAQR